MNNIFWKNDTHTIVCDDCMNTLSEINDESVDLIFCDPPYNIGKDFGNNLDKKEHSEYIEWCESWINECMRVLKNDGTIYIMMSTQYMSYVDIYMQENYHIIQRIIWKYDSSGVQARKYFGSLYEPLLMCVKNKKTKYTFNKDDILVEAKTGSQRKLIDYRGDKPRPYSKFKVPGNVWEFNRVRYKMKEYTIHPTQKPVTLLERIIKASSNPNDLVLDPFSGSGTTAYVCGVLNRKSLNIELNPEYCNIIKKRIINRSIKK